MSKILEIGSGRKWTKWEMNTVDEIVCVDRCYDVYDEYEKFGPSNNISLVYENNVVSYLENYQGELFNEVHATRIFEHFDYTEIPYILYCIYSIMNKGGMLLITVPDFELVAKKVSSLDYHNDALSFNRAMIDVHTELFNTPDDPHKSIWTQNLAEYYMRLEGFWENIDITPEALDNRAWYMRISAFRK